MSAENFEKFRQLVLEDLDLQKDLREISDRDDFILRLIEIGAAHKIYFDFETVQQAMYASRRVWIERWM